MDVNHNVSQAVDHALSGSLNGGRPEVAIYVFGNSLVPAEIKRLEASIRRQESITVKRVSYGLSDEAGDFELRNSAVRDISSIAEFIREVEEGYVFFCPMNAVLPDNLLSRIVEQAQLSDAASLRVPVSIVRGHSVKDVFSYGLAGLLVPAARFADWEEANLSTKSGALQMASVFAAAGTIGEADGVSIYADRLEGDDAVIPSSLEEDIEWLSIVAHADSGICNLLVKEWGRERFKSAGSFDFDWDLFTKAAEVLNFCQSGMCALAETAGMKAWSLATQGNQVQGYRVLKDFLCGDDELLNSVLATLSGVPKDLERKFRELSPDVFAFWFGAQQATATRELQTREDAAAEFIQVEQALSDARRLLERKGVLDRESGAEESRVRALEARVDAVLNSTSYKLGNILVRYPSRVVKRYRRWRG